MKEKMSVVCSEDYGRDEQSAMVCTKINISFNMRVCIHKFINKYMYFEPSWLGFSDNYSNLKDLYKSDHNFY